MNPMTEQLLKVVRFFGVFEKERVCCGTVTIPQCVVLQELLGGPRKISDLASFAGVAASTVTRLVDGLEKKGYVRRVPSQEDRRQVWVELREAGEQEALRLRGLTDLSVEQVLSYLPPERKEEVLSAMALVAQAMEKALEVGTACCGPFGGCDETSK